MISGYQFFNVEAVADDLQYRNLSRLRIRAAIWKDYGTGRNGFPRHIVPAYVGSLISKTPFALLYITPQIRLLILVKGVLLNQYLVITKIKTF